MIRRAFLTFLAFAVCVVLCVLLARVEPLHAFRLRGGGAPPSSCGPDTAPSQATAAGFTCETYRWGTGDTAAEIDSTNANVPGYKLYLMGGSFTGSGRNATTADYSFESGGAHRLIIQPVNDGLLGAAPAILSTCLWPSAPSSSISILNGNSFQGGFYWEFSAVWNATGDDGTEGHAGNYGLTPPGVPPNPSSEFIELDSPDGLGIGLIFNVWNGGVRNGISNSGTNDFGNQTVQTGDKWGVLSTNSGVSWYFNDATNGVVDFASYPMHSTAYTILYSSPMCVGILGGARFPTYVNSLKMWQAPP
jgi:hypothetical protein